MTTSNVTKYLKFANVQMAAESYFGRAAADWVVGDTRQNITPEDLTGMLTDGNRRSSKFTPTLATDFLKNWQLVEHLANTKSGFSGTLFKAISNDDTQGIREGELVLSFRSTEFADDAVRDNLATNQLEIRKHGFAFGQIADMEAWYKSLRTANGDEVAKISATDKISVTGYSLGGHLATAFNILRREAGELSTKVMGTYTFNGAGVGEVQNNKKLTDVINQFEAYRNNGATFTDSVVSNIYNQLKAKLNTGSAPSSSDIELANSLLDQSAAIHARAKNVKEAQSVIDAITRVKRITDREAGDECGHRTCPAACSVPHESERPASREVGTFDRTASVKRLPRACASLPRTRSGGIRDVRHEPRMATLTSRVVINAFSQHLIKTTGKTPNSPIDERLGAKQAETARPDCTLLFPSKDSLHARQRTQTDGAAANDLIETHAA